MIDIKTKEEKRMWVPPIVLRKGQQINYERCGIKGDVEHTHLLRQTSNIYQAPTMCQVRCWDRNAYNKQNRILPSRCSPPNKTFNIRRKAFSGFLLCGVNVLSAQRLGKCWVKNKVSSCARHCFKHFADINS